MIFGNIIFELSQQNKALSVLIDYCRSNLTQKLLKFMMLLGLKSQSLPKNIFRQFLSSCCRVRSCNFLEKSQCITSNNRKMMHQETT